MENDVKLELEKIANYIYSKGISIPLILFLESTKYIAFIGSQFLYACGPVVTAFLNEAKYYKFTKLLEDRKNIDYLLSRIEQLNLKNKLN
tara:strand:- start:91 stop:360 length:270 start_codon:yes stop_codon:yes gene_type:complete